MHPIFLKVQNYLARANTEAAGMPNEVIVQFAKDCAAALNRHFNERPKDNFTLRLSNVGRPLCQLQMDKAGEKGEAPEYSHKMRMLFGDLHEAAAIAIMRAAKVNIKEVQKRVAVPVVGTEISGTLDLVIDEDGEKVWDIKSASPYAFQNKFLPGYDTLKRDDNFGYISQGFSYAEGAGKPFGGWIVIEKVSGEWAVVEAKDTPEERRQAMERVEKNVYAIRSNVPFERSFTDEPEFYRKKETGNRVLGTACRFCPHKWKCWPTLQYRTSLVSQASFPQFTYYTHIDPKHATEGKS